MAASGPYSNKPRPVLIVQRDEFDTDSITVCLLTSDPVQSPLMRIPITPNKTNGLNELSSLMVDKITTTTRGRLKQCIGTLTDHDMTKFNNNAAIFLGIA
jgi:mRNA interferase MazF